MSTLVAVLAAIAFASLVYSFVGWLLVRQDRPRRWNRGGRT